MERLRSVENTPVMLEQTYIPNIDLPNFIEEELIDGSLFRTLYMKYQIDVISLVQEIRAVAADNRTIIHLKTKPKAPILHILRKYTTSRAGFYLYSSTYCLTEKYAISSFN